MNGLANFRTLLDGIKADRHQLHRTLYALIRLAGAATAWSCQDGAQFLDRLLGLQSLLVARFDMVRTGGVLDEALCATPNLTQERMSLEQDHRQLLGELEALISAVPAGSLTRPQWLQVGMTIQRLTTHLLAYELTESRLLVRGFNVDLDVDC